MRLWHKDLIPVLPRQQLLGQWRECCAIMANIAKNGTPNHVLVNKVMNFHPYHLFAYSSRVVAELHGRGYRADFERFRDRYKDAFGDRCYTKVSYFDLFAGWMNDRYLTQNYYNLQEKYDFGAITDEEWDRIEKRYRELIGK